MAIKLIIKVVDYDHQDYEHLLVDVVVLKNSICNVTHFVHRNRDFGEYWAVSEFRTGAQVGRGWSVSLAIEKATFNINRVGEEEYQRILGEHINEYGRANLGSSPAGEDITPEAIEAELKAFYDAEQTIQIIDLSE